MLCVNAMVTSWGPNWRMSWSKLALVFLSHPQWTEPAMTNESRAVNAATPRRTQSRSSVCSVDQQNCSQLGSCFPQQIGLWWWRRNVWTQFCTAVDVRCLMQLHLPLMSRRRSPICPSNLVFCLLTAKTEVSHNRKPLKMGWTTGCCTLWIICGSPLPFWPRAEGAKPRLQRDSVKWTIIHS